MPQRRASTDDGFVLLESVMAIAVITIVMTALTTFFITTMSSAAHLRARQGAIQIANSGMELVHGVGARGAWAGRSPGAVDAQWAAAPGPVQPWLTSMGPAADPGSPSPPTLPTTDAHKINGLNYTVNYYVGWCLRPAVDTDAATSCKANAAGAYAETKNYTQYVRAVVAVTWTDQSCPDSSCTYLTASLLNGGIDPTYNYNSPPPAPPVLRDCQTQTSFVGDAVDRSILAVGGAPGCQVTGGVPTFTYVATGLPPGLEMNATTGKVTGTVKGGATTATVTVVVTDGFLRKSDPVQFAWKVYPALTITTPLEGSVRNGSVGAEVRFKAVAAGGSGGPYTWEATGLPNGLSPIDPSSGVISGVPTTVAEKPVTLTVKDVPTGATKQVMFTWKITPALVIAKPSTQTTTQTATVTELEIVASGGSGNYSFTWSSFPDGLNLDSATGKISGIVASAAKNFNVKVTVTDNELNQAKSETFTWKVNAPPTLNSPGNQTTVRKQVANLQVGAACPNAPCKYTISKRPSWLSLDTNTGILTGTAPDENLYYTDITITVTDAAGVSVTTPLFNWNVITKLSVIVTDQESPYDQITIPLSDFVTGGLGIKEEYKYDFKVTGLGAGFAKFSVNGGVLNGTAGFPILGPYKLDLVFTVTDMANEVVRSAPFTLKVKY